MSHDGWSVTYSATTQKLCWFKSDSCCKHVAIMSHWKRTPGWSAICHWTRKPPPDDGSPFLRLKRASQMCKSSVSPAQGNSSSTWMRWTRSIRKECDEMWWTWIDRSLWQRHTWRPMDWIQCNMHFCSELCCWRAADRLLLVTKWWTLSSYRFGSAEPAIHLCNREVVMKWILAEDGRW